MLGFNIYKLFSVLQLVGYILAVIYNPSGPQWGVKSNDVFDITMSNPVNQVYYSFIFILSVIAIIPHYKSFFYWLNREKFILFFLIWAGVTVLIAINPFVAFKRYFQYITTSLVFISFFLNFSNEKLLLNILKYLFSTYLVITLIICVLIPDAKDPAFNTWRGLHATKNNLGQHAAIIIIFFTFQYVSSFSRLNKLYNIFFVLLSIILLIGSVSMTNIVLINVFAIFFFLLSSKKILNIIGIGYNFVISLIVVYSIIIGVTLILYPEIFNIFFDITGKDPTLTGRTDIWLLLLSQNTNNLITGVGFQSFWIPEKLSKLTLFQYWLPNQSHNGYLDIILEIGIVGLILFLLVIYSFMKNAKTNNNYIWISIVFYTLLLNLSESTLIRPHHFTNVMFYCSFWAVSFKRFKALEG